MYHIIQKSRLSNRTVKDELDALNAKMAGIVLWENPNPASNFPAQTVNLSSDDYDVYEIFYTVRSNGNSLLSARSIKGHGTELNTGYVDNSTLQQRAVTYISDTSLRFENAYSGTTAINGYIRPIKIIGYKL